MGIASVGGGMKFLFGGGATLVRVSCLAPLRGNSSEQQAENGVAHAYDEKDKSKDEDEQASQHCMHSVLKSLSLFAFILSSGIKAKGVPMDKSLGSDYRLRRLTTMEHTIYKGIITAKPPLPSTAKSTRLTRANE